MYPPDQPTIIIGPNSIRAVPNTSIGIASSLGGHHIYPSLGSSINERGNRRLRESLVGGIPGEYGGKMRNAGDGDNQMMNDYDEEDDDYMRGNGYL